MIDVFKLTVVVQLISATLGIPINLLVLLVRVFKFCQKKKISSYQFIIFNLAAADLLSSVVLCIQVEYAVNSFSWSHSTHLCIFVKYVSEICNSIPGLLILLLSFERYYGTVNLTKKWRLRTTIIVSFLIWVFTILSRTPTALVSTTYQYGNTTVCSILEYAKYGGYYLNFRTITFFAIPLVTTIFFHIKLYLFIKSHHHKMAYVRKFSGTTIRRSSFDPSQLSHNNSRRPTLHAILEYEEASTSFIGDLMLEQTAKKGYLQKKLNEILNCLLCACCTNKNENPLNREQRITRNIPLKIHILLAITIFFFLCFLPHHAYHYLFFYNRQAYVTIWRKVSWLSWFRYFHCFINGFIYSVMDKTFRKDVRKILKSIYACRIQQMNDESLVTANLTASRTASIEF